MKYRKQIFTDLMIDYIMKNNCRLIMIEGEPGSVCMPHQVVLRPEAGSWAFPSGLWQWPDTSLPRSQPSFPETRSAWVWNTSEDHSTLLFNNYCVLYNLLIEVEGTYSPLLSRWRKKSLAASLMAFSGVTSVRLTAAPVGQKLISWSMKTFGKFKFWEEIPASDHLIFPDTESIQ